MPGLANREERPTELESWLTGLVCCAWAVALTDAFWPGLMSLDSVEQLAQGTVGAYTSNPRPTPAYVNGLVWWLWGSLWPLVLFQLLVLSGAMAIVLRGAKPLVRRGGLLLFLLVPTIWTLGVTLWRDVAMAACLAAAIAALSSRRWIIATGFLVAALLCRHNAIVAVAPLAVLVARAALPGTLKVQALFGAGVLAVVVAGARLVEFPLQGVDTCPTCALLLEDLAGIASQSEADFAASPLASQTTYPELRRNYSTRSASGMLYVCEPKVWCDDMFGYPTPERAKPAIEACHQAISKEMHGAGGRCLSLRWAKEHRDELGSAWMRALTERPEWFVSSKVERYLMLLGLSTEDVYYPFQEKVAPNWFGIKLWESDLAPYLTTARAALRDTVLFRGAFWVSLVLLLLALAIRRRHVFAGAIAASGFLYAAAYLPSAPAADFRYLFWVVVAGFVAGACLVSKDPLA